MVDCRLEFPATQRNSKPIANVLQGVLPRIGTVLEVASGSGEHAVSFQKLFPSLRWQATDLSLLHVKSISSWINYEGLQDIMPVPFVLDVSLSPWQLPKDLVPSICAIVCINLMHITNWDHCKLTIVESARLLRCNSPLFIYGPFKKNGKHVSQTNVFFDKSLRERNPDWGIRDIEDLEVISNNVGLSTKRIIKMPANNFSLVFTKLG